MFSANSTGACRQHNSTQRRTLQRAPDGKVGDGRRVAGEVGAQRQERVDAGAHALERLPGNDLRASLEPLVDLAGREGVGPVDGGGGAGRHAQAAHVAQDHRHADQLVPGWMEKEVGNQIMSEGREGRRP